METYATCPKCGGETKDYERVTMKDNWVRKLRNAHLKLVRDVGKDGGLSYEEFFQSYGYEVVPRMIDMIESLEQNSIVDEITFDWVLEQKK